MRGRPKAAQCPFCNAWPRFNSGRGLSIRRPRCGTLPVMSPGSRRHASPGLVRGLNKPPADDEPSLALQRRLLSAQFEFHPCLTFARTVPLLAENTGNYSYLAVDVMKTNRSLETTAKPNTRCSDQGESPCPRPTKTSPSPFTKR